MASILDRLRGNQGEPTTETATVDPAVAAAHTEVAHLENVERRWAGILRDKRAELADLEAISGTEALDLESDAAIFEAARDHAARVTAVQAEISAAERTIAALQERRKAASTAVNLAEANALRRQAVAGGG